MEVNYLKMKLLKFAILFYVISITSPGEAYRILGIFPFNGRSHFVMFGPLMKGLAERGHQVDVVGHFPLKKPLPNYNDVVNLSGTRPDVANNMTLQMLQGLINNVSLTYQIATLFGNEICDLMSHPELQNLIKNPPKNPAYDLVIVEIFGANCYLAMGQHLKVPMVGLISSLMFPWANDFIANPDNTAYIPSVFADVNGRMNFWQRVKNTLINLKVKWDFYPAIEQQNDMIKKYIGPDAPTLREAESNVSLILVNSHYSLHGARPFTTAVVEVGGLHIDDRDAKLPKDLQKWLDDCGDGFVYISFGSMIKIESLSKETLAAMYASLAKLAPVRVLIKIAKAEELPSGLPSNVLTRPWISQLAVLKHKNIRAFMTHGGLMGTQEAVYCGVPMIGVPIFGDQVQNINLYSQLNLAVAVDLNRITSDVLDAAFHAVLHDPSYMQAAKKMSALFRDRPMSAMDTAIFWIEYVIRHGGTNLRSPAMDLAWWQIALLDVYGFLISSVLLFVYLIIVIVKKLKGVFFARNVKSTKESKKVK